MAGLRERLDEDLKAAMRAKDEHRLSVLRLVRAGIKNTEVAQRKPLDEQGILGVLTKEMRERKDSLDQFQKAGRTDLVTKESAELAILQEYLPQQLSRDEIEVLVRDAMAETGVTAPDGKGKLMAALMPRVRGKADGREVNAVVTELLGG